MALIRRGRRYEIHEVLDHAGPGAPVREYDGVLVRMSSLRYQTFQQSGTACVVCGRQGWYFALEQQGAEPGLYWHFNLYGLDDRGDEVLMTRDHIIPRSKGGREHVSNMQTMCELCNQRKADQELAPHEVPIYRPGALIWRERRGTHWLIYVAAERDHRKVGGVRERVVADEPQGDYYWFENGAHSFRVCGRTLAQAQAAFETYARHRISERPDWRGVSEKERP